MKTLPFDLNTLCPQMAKFNVSGFVGQLTLAKWTLRVRLWCLRQYGEQGMREMFEKTKIEDIAAVAFFMLVPEDKAKFNNEFDNFCDAIITVQDQINVVVALNTTIGIGEPEMKSIIDQMKKASGELAEAVDPKPKSKPKKNTSSK